MRRSVPRFVLQILIIVLSSRLGFAQPLADRVPADAMVYVGWSGIDPLPVGYEGSHLKAILDNSKIRELFSEFLPQWMDRLAARQPGAMGPMMVARTLLAQMAQHPTAIYFSGIDLTNPQRPVPRFGLLCKAGRDADVLARQIGQLTAQAPPDVPIRSTTIQDMVVVTVGYAGATQGVATNDGLNQAASFTAAMKQVQANPVTAVYIDVEKLLALVDQAIQMNVPPQARVKVSNAIDATGLRGLKRIISTSGFDGADWMCQTFCDAPAPRSGFLESLDNTPISAELLRSVPVDATFVATGRLNLAKSVTRLRDAVASIDPEVRTIVDRVMGAANLVLARNLVTEVLEPLGEDWAIYCSPSTSGNGILGAVVVNRLNDPAQASSSLAIAWTNLSNWANVALRRNNVDVQILGRTIEIDGLNVNYAGTPVFAPAWAIKDGYLYLGLYPQSVASAARVMGRSAGKSFAQNDKFVVLQKRLGVSNPRSFSFYDLPATATQGSSYQQMLVLARYAGFSDLFGVPLPEPLLPPLDVIQKHLSPAGSFSWVDNTGLHAKAISPFPGSRMLSEPGMVSAYAPGASALMVSILLPSLNRARETANRVKCASNLKMIGQGLLLYANDNRGRYPQTLGELVTKGATPIEAFVCPSGSTQIPPNIRSGTPEQQAQWVNASANYVYLGAGKPFQNDSRTILVYEKPEDHGQGMNMLFGDGHVEFILNPEGARLIQRQP